MENSTKGKDSSGEGREECRDWLNLRQAADYLGISYERLTTKVKEGVYPVSFVPGFKNEKRLNREKLNEILLESEVPARNAKE